MTRRDLLHALGWSGLALALPSVAQASDSGNSSDSGDSSAGSGASSGQSADSSGQSADSSQGSADSSQQSSNSSNNSSNSDAAFAESGDQSASSAAVSAIGLTLSTTAGLVILIVALSRPAPARQNREHQKKPSPSALLLESGFLYVQRDLGLQIAALASSPAALDRLAAEAAVGEGPALSALAAACRLPVAQVARATFARWSPAATTRDATRIALQILADLAPDLAPDPDFIAESLYQLRREQRRPEPAYQPTHQRIATWMGVGAHDYVPVIAATLSALPGRAALHEDPLAASDALGDALEAAFPDTIADRIRRMTAAVARLNRDLALGIPGLTSV